MNEVPAAVGARVAFQGIGIDSYRDRVTTKLAFVWRGFVRYSSLAQRVRFLPRG